MKRGQLYRVRRPNEDPKSFRAYLIVSRQAVLDSRYSTVVCAPVFTNGDGLSTQVSVGVDEGMKHPRWIMCDNLVSVRKSVLTQYVGSLSVSKMIEVNRALAAALDLA
jgi:mRNA interferase MazF